MSDEQNHEQQIIDDEAWQLALDSTGETVKTGTVEGETRRSKVLARSYTLNAARRRLNIKKYALERAIEEDIISAFIDPVGKIRLPASVVEDTLKDPDKLEQIAGYERIRARDVALVLDINIGLMRKWLAQANANRSRPLWHHIRGKWDLPDTLAVFREELQTATAQQKTRRRDKRENRKRRARERREQERQRRNQLRQQLLDAFPVWHEEDRTNQFILLHIGPPNSGKTHDALNRLAESEDGWYLAPLRLLAFEIFDRLNRRGVPCNLLTGEESIEIPGATLTAATIEMFNPNKSGECVIIDEAQMLADADRGWAWTRAMIECQAPEMHVIAPPTARQLIQRMAEAADIPLGITYHERLAPIKVADRHWSLRRMPERTILVAFSRRMVLELKASLEKLGRSVSVVYGSLPPEVRRKQADRFADGETEICIATDAVGMGLNLPADYVCFYETKKYDGREVRRLTPAEVHQIGGRAGRYGMSRAGEIGAISPEDLRTIRYLYGKKPEELRYAHVAPTVADLAMIPGSLADKLQEWGQLHSIPEGLRSLVTTANLNERINLARMLSDDEVTTLGLDRAVQLINAPTRRSSRDYWYECALAIIEDTAMPVPDIPPSHIENTSDLEYAESCIARADVYLWLSQRDEFDKNGPDAHFIREERMAASRRIDEALLKKLDPDYIPDYDRDFWDF